jgi:hypothetical protein
MPSPFSRTDGDKKNKTEKIVLKARNNVVGIKPDKSAIIWRDFLTAGMAVLQSC